MRVIEPTIFAFNCRGGKTSAVPAELALLLRRIRRWEGRLLSVAPPRQFNRTLANAVPAGNFQLMNRVGLSEAKTKFAEICERVEVSGEPIVVTRHGKPLIKIAPVSPPRNKVSSVWAHRAEYVKRHGLWSDDFNLPPRH